MRVPEALVKRNADVFGNRFEIVEYKGDREKFCFRCSTCHMLTWMQAANFRHTKEPCVTCRKRKAEQRFLESMSSTIRERYIVGSFDYGTKGYAKFRCGMCQEVLERRTDNVSKLRYLRCNYCQYSFDKYDSLQERGDAVFGHGMYSYEDSQYVNAETHIAVLCLLCCNTFDVTPNNHFNLKSSCPICAHGRVSRKGSEWLDKLEVPRECRERWLWLGGKRMRVDARVENVVYEFLGRYWHGDPRYISAETIVPELKRTAGELYVETKTRLMSLQTSGFNVVYVWELDYDNGCMTSDYLP